MFEDHYDLIGNPAVKQALLADRKEKTVKKAEPVLTWTQLNDELRKANEERCLELLEAEKEGRHRKQFLLRIQSRRNKLRRQRERAQLLKVAAS